jgi:putative transposase
LLIAPGMMAIPDNEPRRQRLPHTTPDFVKAGSVFFVTICARPRGCSVFTTPQTWSVLQHSAEHYHTTRSWHLRLLLAMPDHLHLLVSFPQETSMARVIRAWKHYVARHTAVSWQRDFFDHRLRTDEGYDEKAHYIRQNPVRANLASIDSDWPFIWPR